MLDTLLCLLQCSSLAPINGKQCSVNELFWNKENTCLCPLCKTFCMYHPHSIIETGIYILFFYLTRFFIMQKGFTLLLINLDNSTTIQVKVAFNRTSSSRHKHRFHRKHIRLPQGYKSENDREEYHLTAKDGNLHSQTMLLNGKILTLNSSGDIPPLEPLYANSSSPISVAPFSIVFAHIPNVVPPACR